MKIALVTGRCPPGECGVGDYTVCLADALRRIGLDAEVIEVGDWRLIGALKVRDSLHDFDFVHIQYPTLGFGYKLGPQTLSLLRSCVVTVHEASQRRVLRKLSLLPFMVRPQHVIFTSDFEREFVTRRVPWVAGISSVIPVLSNIRAFPGERQRTLREVVYFGLILPKKGLEQIVELSRLIKLRGLALKVRIIGRRRPEHIGYLEKLRSITAELPVIWDLELSEEQVAERLASSSVAYLPFPDGASERRTSLKAALANGVAVVTTRGSHTSANLENILRFSNNPEEALTAACSLMESEEERTNLARNAVQYLRRFTWEQVAQLHLAIYTSLVSLEYGSDPVEVESIQENP